MDMNAITVNVPLKEIIALYRAIEQHNGLELENAQLRREIEGLRTMQHECMMVIGELRKAIKII